MNQNVKKNPVYIFTWESLAQVPPSKTHKLMIDVKYANGWIVSLDEETYVEYLSTHTFYHQETCDYFNKIFEDCGFNIKIMKPKEMTYKSKHDIIGRGRVYVVPKEIKVKIGWILIFDGGYYEVVGLEMARDLLSGSGRQVGGTGIIVKPYSFSLIRKVE